MHLVIIVDLPTETKATPHNEDRRPFSASTVLSHLLVPGGELSKGRADEHQQLGILARYCHPYRSHDDGEGRQDALRTASRRAQKITHTLLAAKLTKAVESIVATVHVF